MSKKLCVCLKNMFLVATTAFFLTACDAVRDMFGEKDRSEEQIVDGPRRRPVLNPSPNEIAPMRKPATYPHQNIPPAQPVYQPAAPSQPPAYAPAKPGVPSAASPQGYQQPKSTLDTIQGWFSGSDEESELKPSETPVMENQYPSLHDVPEIPKALAAAKAEEGKLRSDMLAEKALSLKSKDELNAKVEADKPESLREEFIKNQQSVPAAPL